MGGPITFLAGLAMIGGSGLVNLNDRLNQEKAMKEYNEKNERPKWQLCLLNSAMGYMGKEYGGYDTKLMIKAVKDDGLEQMYPARTIVAMALAKHFIEEMGYNFHYQSEREKEIDLDKYTTDKFLAVYEPSGLEPGSIYELLNRIDRGCSLKGVQTLMAQLRTNPMQYFEPYHRE